MALGDTYLDADGVGDATEVLHMGVVQLPVSPRDGASRGFLSKNYITILYWDFF
jgi:hypothetical protein